MATINNPFVMYGYKGAEYFCDREKETEKMMTSLHNERNITLVAPRRMGKTGLIHPSKMSSDLRNRFRRSGDVIFSLTKVYSCTIILLVDCTSN